MAGATGLVGQAVLAALLADKRYAAVHCVGRRPPALKHPNLHAHVLELASLKSLPGIAHVDDVFIALGTTIKVAGSQAAFRAVDFDAVVAVAGAAKKIGASRLGVVSAMGASPTSSVFYSRVKGEMEQALTQLGYRTLVIARPSMLAGDRAALAQPERLGEHIALIATRWLKPMIPANYRTIAGEAVAQALISAVQQAKEGKRVLLSGEMQP